MILEPARESDWEDIRRLSVQIHDLHALWRPDIYYHSDEPYPKDFFLEDMGEDLIYVSRDQGRVTGYVLFSILEKGGPGTVNAVQLRVDSICVDEVLRGRGIGKAMMSDLCSIAAELGCNDILLGVHPENERGLDFYRSCGFEIRTINMQKKL